MSVMMSVRLDETTERMVKRLAQDTGRSRSALVRAGIALLAEKESAPRGPYQAIAHLIGCVRDAPADLSARTGEGLRRVLRSRRK